MIIKEQKDIEQLLGGSSKILIVTKANPNVDDVASALAWFNVLRVSGKERVSIVADIPEQHRGRFKFLPGFDYSSYTIQGAEHFVIRVNASKTKVKELSYDVRGDTLEIFLKPEGGNFTSKDVSFAESSFSFDCILVFGAADLASVGSVFENNRELFFHTPIITVDRQSSNVRYGQINAVYLTATSLAEISYELLKDKMSTEIATCLLAGLISATSSFQTPQVTPETLHLASELIIAGAPREDIVHSLYRTKDITKMRLWGLVLSRIQQVDTYIIYSHLIQEDIANADIDLQGLVDELVLSSPEAHVVIFFYQRSTSETAVYVYSRDNYDLPLMLQKYEPKGSRRQVAFTVQKNSQETEREVLEHVRQLFKMVTH